MFKHLLEKNDTVNTALRKELESSDITFIGALITFVQKYSELDEVCNSMKLAVLDKNIPAHMIYLS